jgi:hypothetical protein
MSITTLYQTSTPEIRRANPMRAERDNAQFQRPQAHSRYDHASRRQVAALSSREISRMSCEEMVQVIRAIRLPHLREGMNDRLPYLGEETLRRLVFLTRRYCRNLI